LREVDPQRRAVGAGFAHSHLQSGTVGDWPLNVPATVEGLDG
jgi:hypothetical protein